MDLEEFIKKKPCQLSCSNTTNATFIYESSALWFHIAILYILSLFKLTASRVMLCTFRTLIIHEHDTKHCSSVMTIIQNLVIPLKQKRKAGSESSCSWFLVQKNKRGKEGKMTRAKIWMMDKCLCLHLHMIKVFEWYCYLETHCLNLQIEWKRWEHTSVTIYTHERALPLWGSYTRSALVNWAFKSLPHFQKV